MAVPSFPIPIQTFDMSAEALEALFPVNIHGWVVLDRAPDPEILRKAVIGVLEEFPAIASGLKPGWIRSRYVLPESLEPPLSVSDDATDDPESIPEPLLNFFRTPLNMQKGPLSAFCLVRGKSLAFLGINVHHVACDGRGIRHLISALADHYTSLASGKESIRPKFRKDRIPNIIYQQYSFRRRMSLIAQGFKVWGRMLGSARCDLLDAPTTGAGVFTPLFFSGDSRAGIISRCKSLGITVNDLFISALARTYLRWNGKINLLKYLIPQDLRPWGRVAPGALIEDGEWRAVGNILGGFSIQINGSELADPERLYRLVNQRSMKEKKAQSALALASLSILPINILPLKPLMAVYRHLDAGKLMRILRTSIIFSNLGTVSPDQLRFGDCHPIHFGFTLPYIEKAGPMFTAAGVGDSISFAIAHSQGLDAKKFLAFFQEELFR